MEFEVRVVGGIENCFVSLPLSLIHTLQSTAAYGFLPPILPLELRNGDNIWRVSWSGSASSSSTIEIGQQYGKCIGLPDSVFVQVKVMQNVAKAQFVAVEPQTEDDWETLELNAELAKEEILKQVGIVHEAMGFPLWLRGQYVRFLVVSTFPKAPVQLVPGTDVSVAPKLRRRASDSLESQKSTKSLLRVQDLESRFTGKYEMNGAEIGVALTSVVFIHPESASRHSLNPLQIVKIVSRSLHQEPKNNHEADSLRRKGSKTGKEVPLMDKQEQNQAVVRLVFSESVAKGHVMLSQTLRLYLRAGLHSWVYLKSLDVPLSGEIPSLKISPFQFKIFEKNEAFETNSLEVANGRSAKIEGTRLWTYSDSEIDLMDWITHDRIFAALSSEPSGNDHKEAGSDLVIRKVMPKLLHAWCLAHLAAFTSNTTLPVNSLLLGGKTILHFVVKGEIIAQLGNLQGLGGVFFKGQNHTVEPSLEILYVMSISEESMSGKRRDFYELSFDGCRENIMTTMCEEILPKLQYGDGICFNTLFEKAVDPSLSVRINSLNWMETAVSDVSKRLSALLSPNFVQMLSKYDLPLPGHVLIYGPPGSGKTLLANVAANTVQVDKEILAHVVFISCSKLSSEKQSSIRHAISGYISEALDHAPSVVIFDDIDSIVTSSSNSEEQFSFSSGALTQFFVDILDEYEEKRTSMCGIGPVAFVATAQLLTNVPQTLSSSGRFDFHVKLPAPAAPERVALLKQEIQRRALECSDDVILDVASKCDGYDAYDLEILVDRSIHAAAGRYLLNDTGPNGNQKPRLVGDDFLHGMKDFLPVAMRDITKPSSDGSHSGWEDVGGLDDVRNAITEMLELPSKFPRIFSQAPLRMRSNVLLYGPPGCGKTHIVGAAAASCSLRFISVKGPELLNKYIGASEQAVRDIFTKAAAAAPCLLFFDEFDSIAPKRGHDNTGVTDRVVNQFLTELDGVEVLTGVFVFAATSRPDLLDAALLRPGRLDRLLFCDFPSQRERLDILKVLSRKLPLASDVDLGAIARVTEGFSGADLQALLSDAQLEAVHELLGNDDDAKTGKMPVISDSLLKSVVTKTKPSLSQTEKRRLYDIYGQFLDSRRSVAVQSRDAKGKRATLA